ncbi:MAG: alpha/beta fold hydrolase [Minicystis sp.]
MSKPLRRCHWAGDDPRMIAYHDTEWGVPQHDDRVLFEFLILEGAQAGLSWSTILRKREAYRAAFAGFDPAQVARFGEAEVKALLANEGIVRNRLKVHSAIQNARAVLAVQAEHGSLDAYLWQLAGVRPHKSALRKSADVPARTAVSDAMSKALQKRGFNFVGSTICYAFMQATGMVNDHLVGCFRRNEISTPSPHEIPPLAACATMLASMTAERTTGEPIDIKHHHVDVGGVRLHVAEAGSGPLVVLLHGFPEFWYTWRHVLPALARAGFRVAAPDLRGYNLSDKPEGVSAYGIRALAADVDGLIRALGAERASVVGHDWGAGAAWAFAMAYPERLDRLAILNGPHPQKMLEGLRRPAQLLKSWYMFFFLLPALPEVALREGDYAILQRSFREEPIRAGAYTEADLARYREAWSQRGALTAMVNYYRAMPLPSARVPMRRIDAPVLVLWGDGDPHLGRDLAEPPPDLVPHARVEHIADASHWVHHDQPERVIDELTRFLRGDGQGSSAARG